MLSYEMALEQQMFRRRRNTPYPAHYPSTWHYLNPAHATQKPLCFSYPSTTPSPPKLLYFSLSLLASLSLHLSPFTGSCRGVTVHACRADNKIYSSRVPCRRPLTTSSPKTPGSATLPGTLLPSFHSISFHSII